MTRFLLLSVLLFSVSAVQAKITRERVEHFDVEPGAHIEINIHGGSIQVTVGESDRVEVVLKQTARTNSESEADEMIAELDTLIEQSRGNIRVITHPQRSSGSWWSRIKSNNRVQTSARLTVPAQVNLNLDTSGGGITVTGLVDGDLVADTSGGPIRVTGARGDLNLDTSGGGITVKEAYGRVRADTSGGGIRIDYIGPETTDVNADTSGGGITIGLDPRGGYDLNADTSGGGVSVEGLNFNAHKRDRTHAEGEINGGGVRVRADTSGGGIKIYAAER